MLNPHAGQLKLGLTGDGFGDLSPRRLSQIKLVDVINSGFPRLKASGEYAECSQPDENYNCIAFAAGVDDAWWWPGPIPEHYWPPTAPREETVSACVAAFQSIGYRKCRNGELVAGFEKVVIYGKDDELLHAARQDPETGFWLSKLGKCHDILHHNVADVGGMTYGEPVCYMRRRINASRWRRLLLLVFR